MQKRRPGKACGKLSPRSLRPPWVLHFVMFRKMVEAAGVEPASEKARNKKNYVRSRLLSLDRRPRPGRKDGHPARLISI